MDFKKTIETFKNKRIAVIYGGWSSEREISILTGQAIMESLARSGLNAFGLDLKRDNFFELEKASFDFAYLALHGEGGEDGKIQAYFELKNIPYTGSSSLSSSIAMNKFFTKNILEMHNIPTAKCFKIDLTKEIPQNLFDKIIDGFPFPFIVKPVSQGSAIGVFIVNSESEFFSALENIKKIDSSALVEKYIKGREFTVGVVGDLVLPVLEIVAKNVFYDFDAKYEPGKSLHKLPENLAPEVIEKMAKYAKKTFDCLGCSGAARVDIICDQMSNIFVLEINTIPGMTELSLLPDAASKMGISFDELVLMILELAKK